MAPALWLGFVRSSKGLSPMKMMPAFGLFANPFTDRPGNATACSTPSCASAMSDILRITASVRSSDAASGSCAIATRYRLSWLGTNPLGTREKPSTPSTTSPAYTASATTERRLTR